MRQKIKRVFIFLIAFLFYYLFQSYLFPQINQNFLSQQKEKTEKAHIEDKSKGNDPGIQDSMEKSIDSLALYLQKELGETFLAKFFTPIMVTIISIPFLIGIMYLMGVLFKWGILKFSTRIFKGYYQKNENYILQISNSIQPFFFILGLRVAIVPIEIYFEQKIPFLRNPANALLIIFSAFALQRVCISLISTWLRTIAQKTSSNIDDQLLPLGLSLLKIVITIFTIFFSLSALGVDITPLVASLGAFTFALGFAVKDSLSNFVAGLFLILDDSFSVGDKVKIPEIGYGLINEIGFRTTKIRTFDHEVIIVPNNIMMNKQYKNYRLPDQTIRVVVEFGVSYGTKIEEVRKAIFKIIYQMENILEEPAPTVEFISMEDFYLSFRAKVFITSYADQYEKKLELTEKIYNQLNSKNIQIPFPTYTVEMSSKDQRSKK